MRLIREISKEGKTWEKTVLYSALPVAKNSRYVILIRNLIIWGFRDVRTAKKYYARLIEDLDKIGIVMELAGFQFHIYHIRELPKPGYERDAIDAEYEVIK
jgi:hypothetical protein